MAGGTDLVLTRRNTLAMQRENELPFPKRGTNWIKLLFRKRKKLVFAPTIAQARLNLCSSCLIIRRTSWLKAVFRKHRY